MSLTNIYNERYGTSVAANDNYIAVGNPPTYDYNPAEGFYRIGEVKLIKEHISVLPEMSNRRGWGDGEPYVKIHKTPMDIYKEAE